jgi:gliding motility-associated-like protein
VATDGKESVFADSICNDNCEKLSFPNIITANGDPKNDAFSPICGPKYLFRSGDLDIYNRWGKKIFTSHADDGVPEWNGRNITAEAQSPLNLGTYYYYLKVMYKRLYRRDEPKVFKGWIEVVR